MPIYHEWNGTVLTITSDSGSTSCDLKGAVGDTGPRGPQGAAGDCYATDTAALGGIPAAEYATKTDVETAVSNVSVDTSNLATKEELETLNNTIETDYALKNELNGLASETYVAEAIAQAQLGGESGEIDLSGYATKEYVDTEIDNINLSSYATMNYVDEAVKGASKGATNLLTNSYFLKAINQRGESTYTGAVYTIDRWRGATSLTSVSIGANGLTFAAIGNANNLYQRFESGTFTGKEMTLAVCDSNNGIHILNATFPDVGAYSEAYTDLNTNVSLLFDARNGFDAIRIGMAAGATSTLTLKWAALYEGTFTADTLPAYIYKGYAAELAECQRYYLSIKGGTNYVRGVGAIGGAKQITPTYYLPCLMRKTPTLVSCSVNLVRAAGVDYTATPSEIVVLTLTSNQLITSIKYAESVLSSVGSIAMVYGNDLVLDAEL